MNRRILIFLLNLYFAIGRGNVEDDCYMTVEHELKRVISSFELPTNFSIPNSFENIDDLLRRLNEIISNIKDLRNVTRTQTSVEEKIDEIKLLPLRNITEVLKSISNELKLYNISNYQSTVKECETADRNFKILQKDFLDIERLGKQMNATHNEVVMTIDGMNNKSLAIKRDLDNIMVPESYACNEQFLESLNGIIIISHRIKNSLIHLEGTVLKKLKNNVGKIRKPEEKLPEAVLVRGSSAPEELKRNIDRLRQKIKELRASTTKLDNSSRGIQNRWNAILHKWKRTLKKQLQEDIEYAQYLELVLHEKKQVEEDFDEIKEIALNLYRMKVCEVYYYTGVEQ